MRERRITLDDVKTAVKGLLDKSSNVRAPITTEFTKMQEKRGKRLAKAEERLKEQLGEDHPRVIALGRAVSRASEFKQSLDKAAEHETNQPKLEPNDWLVFGRVLDADGKPIPKLRVSVFDKDCWLLSRWDDPLGCVETDESGDFAIIYYESDFKESRPDLYLKIEDKAGKELYTSRDAARQNASRSEYFEIRLNKPTFS